MDVKTAAERLLKIADAIEKEAYDNSYFVCDSCNHTANLTTINQRRKTAAEEVGADNVSEVTVNDKIACPACSSDMEYVATEDSDKYYRESADEEIDLDLDLDIPDDDKKSDKKKDKEEEEPKEEEPKEEKKEEEPEEKKEEELDGDLFDPVDEQEENKKKEDDKEEKAKNTETEEDVDLELEDDKDVPAEEKIEEDAEEKPKKKPKKKDKPDDGEASYPKDDSPKFEKMPKDASEERFNKSMSRYASY